MEKIVAQSALDQKTYEISLEGRSISAIQVSSLEKKPDFIFGPGFFDIQVNGYGGVDYNLLQGDYLNLGQITSELEKCGVTRHLPTVITNSKEAIGVLFGQLASLLESAAVYRESIPGFHLEGPFISPEDGPRGAHSKEFVCAPNWEWFQFWQEKAGGMIKLITLSPEWEGSMKFIEKCVDAGITVSIGHTNATHNQIEDAVRAGARLSTHLGNGAHGVLPRHPNYLWSQLAEKDLHASIIADGFHLPREVIQVFHQVKKEKILLVSDSVALAGMPAGDYDTPVGGKVTLSEKGKLHLQGNPSLLAGSAMNLLQGVNFLLKNKLTSIQEAWEMASVRPNQLLFPYSQAWNPLEECDLLLVKQAENSELVPFKIFKNWKKVFP